MVNINQDRWSPSNLQQQRLMQRVVRTLDNMEAKKATVSLVSKNQPSQEDWEAAYNSQTGFSPPIPFGVKLVWIDSGQNRVKTFATSLDNSGVFSTGEIFELVNTEEKYLPIRYIGQGTTYILDNVFQSVFSQLRSSETGDVLSNSNLVSEKAIALQGLQAILIFFRVGSDDITPLEDGNEPLQSNVSAGSWVGAGRVQVRHNGTATTVTEQRVDTWDDVTFPFIDGVATGDYGQQGVILLNNIQEFLESNEDLDLTFSGLNGWGMSVGTLGNISVAGNTIATFNVFNALDAKKVISTGLQVVATFGRMDVYGIYDKKTANNLAEGKRHRDI